MSGIRTATHVYVCTTADGTKIGVSSKPSQRTKFYRGGKLVKTWHRPNDAQTVEHTALKLMGLRPIAGHEWFDASPEQAVAAVDEAVILADAGKATPTPNTQREMREEREMRNFGDALAEIAAKMQPIIDDYERRGYIFDKSIMNFRKK